MPNTRTGRSPISAFKPAFGIVTALPEEYAAVYAAFDESREEAKYGPFGSFKYGEGTIESFTGGKHNLALCLVPDIGTNLAAAEAMALLAVYPTIHTILMIGIAGGCPNPAKPDEHVRLGDIVICNSHGVVQYDFVKETINDVLIRNPPRPPSAALIRASRLLMAKNYLGEQPWQLAAHQICAKLSIERPAETTDILAATDDSHLVLEHPKDSLRVIGQPRVFAGLIGSSNTLLKNAVKRDFLRSKYNVRAIEMEGSGLADAAWFTGSGYLVIRGICDYCDSRKNDEWHNYAAATETSRAGLERARMP